jgi:hypothetical protein
MAPKSVDEENALHRLEQSTFTVEPFSVNGSDAVMRCDACQQPQQTDLVTAFNNVDTVITLVLPSIIIVISNVRISYALSLFYRSMELPDRRQIDHQDNGLPQQLQQQVPQTPSQHQAAQQHHTQHYQQQVTGSQTSTLISILRL